ncbi:MAG: amino acid racemase [Eubacteriales bacterium]|nr:amino acid racemase [Eubacteriales bacterium]
MKERKRLAVLGGMGPLATAVFYNRLVEHAKLRARSDQDHPDVLIWSDCAMPDRSEVIISGESQALLARCQEDFRLFEEADCDYICFPCNTMHYFISDLTKLTTIPILNMIDLCLAKLRRAHPGLKRIQIFATDGTRSAHLYERYATAYDFDVIDVSDQDQEIIMDAIYDLKRTGQIDFPEISQLIFKAISTGIECVILACTELSCMTINPKVAPYVCDAMDALIEECLARVMGG